MMERLDFEVYGCLIAEFVACRSEDKQTKVGGVLLNSETKKLISTGYNGLKQNQNWPIRWDDIENRLEKAGLIIHCEQNLFNHNSYDKGPFTVCLNLSPCESCVKLLVGQNVRKIVFPKKYKDWKQSKKICDFYNIEYRILNKNDISDMIYWVEFVLTKLQNMV